MKKYTADVVITITGKLKNIFADTNGSAKSKAKVIKLEDLLGNLEVNNKTGVSVEVTDCILSESHPQEIPEEAELPIAEEREDYNIEAVDKEVDDETAKKLAEKEAKKAEKEAKKAEKEAKKAEKEAKKQAEKESKQPEVEEVKEPAVEIVPEEPKVEEVKIEEVKVEDNKSKNNKEQEKEEPAKEQEQPINQNNSEEGIKWGFGL